MSRKTRSLPLVLIVVTTLFVAYAVANNTPLSDSEQPVAAGATGSGLAGGILVSSPGLMVVTTAAPMQLPGRVLQPGTYEFRLIDSDGAVAVSSAPDHHFYGVYLVMPTSRTGSNDGAQVTAAAAPNGGPDRIAAWFFPGESSGYAFIYPRKEHKAAAVAMK